MKKIILILVVTLAAIALYYSFFREEEELGIDYNELVDYLYGDGEELEIVVTKLYKYTQDKNIDSLATLFHYPISRNYPTRDILNEKEFIERYEEIFDEVFCNKIADDPCDWSAMGWRGYMYDLGDLWVDYEDSLIMRVNVYSELAERLHQQSIEAERSTLHKSILEHATDPICSFKTKNGEWYGRIDYISSVDNMGVQLSLYKSTTSIDCAPDYLMLGFEDIQGSAHNTFYKFKGVDFNFVVEDLYVYEIGSYPYTLTIEHNYGEDNEEVFDIDWVYWEDLREESL